MKKTKFKFGRRFNFEAFPKIKECHEEYQRLVDLSYEIDALKESDKNEVILENISLDEYELEVYSKAIYEEFHGKGIMLRDSVTKKTIMFDDLCPEDNFQDVKRGERFNLTRIFEAESGWTFPVEYYVDPKKTNDRTM